MGNRNPNNVFVHINYKHMQSNKTIHNVYYLRSATYSIFHVLSLRILKIICSLLNTNNIVIFSI